MADKKISNNLLSILLVFAILVSVIGLFASVNVLQPLTGMATQGNATVNVTITAQASCTLTDTSINFSTSMSASSTGTNDSSDWSNRTDLKDMHTLQNDGNANLTITAWSPEQLWDSTKATNANTYWQIRCNHSEQGDETNTWQAIPFSSGAAVTLVEGLEPDAAFDDATFGVNITVPDDELSGQKGALITYICTAV